MKNRYKIKEYLNIDSGKHSLLMFNSAVRFAGKTILVMLITCFFFQIDAFAQQGECYKRSLKSKTPLRHKIFIGEFENKGTNNDVDFGEIVREKLNEQRHSIFTKDLQIFVPVDSKDEADVIVSGEYVYNNNTEVIEKPFMERSTSYASRIPYFEIRVKNSADLNFVFQFEYKDGTTAFDTLYHEDSSETSDKREIKSQVVLEEETIKTLGRRIWDYKNIVDSEKFWVKMPKVKIKDKEMKSQYKEMRKYVEEKKFKELGAFYKKLYEQKPSDELAQCIGICYEMLGNFEKAQEYYDGASDFAINMRMKDHMELYNYLLEIGMTLPKEEF